MRTIGLEYMKKLEEQLKEKKYDEATKIFGGDGYLMTDEAIKAKATLEEFQNNVTITLAEMEKLEEQAKETRYDENAKILGGDGIIATSNAEKSQTILSVAKLNITLEEMKRLEEEAKETKYDELSNGAFGSNGIVMTQKAIRAKNILEKANVVITLDEMRELEEQEEAILNKASVVITLEERQMLEEKSDEMYDNPDAVLLGGDTRMPTKEAEKAKGILSKAITSITIEEREQLEKQSKEKRAISNLAPFIDSDGQVPTKEAELAERILNSDNLMIGVGEERVLFNSTEIGKATLSEQERTDLKREEEEARYSAELEEEKDRG